MKSSISTREAPTAIGPYSQAVVAGGFVFLSGQIPLDPMTGNLVQGSIEAETERVLENLKAVLSASGSSLAEVVKTTVYLVDLADFVKVNAVYGNYFNSNPPARSTVQVTALPKGARVEIDAIAQISESGNHP